jgi:hypothetical protein
MCIRVSINNSSDTSFQLLMPWRDSNQRIFKHVGKFTYFKKYRTTFLRIHTWHGPRTALRCLHILFQELSLHIFAYASKKKLLKHFYPVPKLSRQRLSVYNVKPEQFFFYKRMEKLFFIFLKRIDVNNKTVFLYLALSYFSIRSFEAFKAICAPKLLTHASPQKRTMTSKNDNHASRVWNSQF